MRSVKIKDQVIENFGVPYVIAEIGANHNGDMDLAKEMISSAVDCGADAVKFQSWTSSSLIAKEEYERNQSYDDSKKKHFGSLFEMVDKYALSTEDHFALKEFCDNLDVDFCSTPFSPAEADLLEKLEVPFFKIASMDITNLRLLRHVAKKKLPVVLSTGMATLAEIDRAVDAIEEMGNNQIILLHCISIYPPAMGDINLNNISMLQRAFDYPIGFSDHSIGSSIPLASVALGACLVEKHFTVDKNLPGWDHEISSDPKELKIICEDSKNINMALGSHHRSISIAEEKKKEKFRRSIVLAEDLPAGHVITEKNIDLKRPGTGIPSEMERFVVGRKLKNSVVEDCLLSWSDLL